jgi:hypothetical protein
MKKLIILFSLVLVYSGIYAQSSDSLLRSAGLFLSPGIADFYLPKESKQPDPCFGFSAGFRFINKLKKGFFIEGGVGFSMYGAKMPTEEIQDYYYYPPQLYSYYRQDDVTQFNITTPFLAGYQTLQGKVRFQGALGIAFNLQNFQFTKTNYTNRPYFDYDRNNNIEPRFGPSFSLIARAGIRVPLMDRMSLDILPAARYRLLYFTTEALDLRESIKTDESPWSLGIDIGLVWALDDKKSEEVYEYEYGAGTDAAYTLNYQSPDSDKGVKRKLVTQGPKNFIYLELAGGGMIYSNNYERTLYRKGILSIQARGGFGFFANRYSIPIGGNISLGHSRKKFEAGILATGENLLFEKFNVNIVPSIAYRCESRRHFFLRLALMTHIVTGTDGDTTPGKMIPGFGVSLGGCF